MGIEAVEWNQACVKLPECKSKCDVIPFPCREEDSLSCGSILHRDLVSGGLPIYSISRSFIEYLDESALEEDASDLVFHSFDGMYLEDLHPCYDSFEASDYIDSSITSEDDVEVAISDNPNQNLVSSMEEICSSFGLTMEEFAEVCLVRSRKSPYNWRAGVSPRKDTLKRIFSLLIIARNWKHAGGTSNSDDLHMPVIDGQSVFELLCREDLNEDLIVFAATSLDLMNPAPKVLDDPFSD